MAESSIRRDVACPACGLVCDDLEVEVTPRRITIRSGACPMGRAWFESEPPVEATAMAAGAPPSRRAAIAAAAGIRRNSRLPVFGGLAADIDGLRGAFALADRTGGVIDHRASRGLFADLTAVRDIGTMTTTFSEVRNRADLLLIVGPDPVPQMPRLIERCFSDAPSLFAESGIVRRLIHLGPPTNSFADLPHGVSYTGISCAPGELAPTVARLRALLKGHGIGEDAALGELA